jgi:holo-[acyl-carrier protein] synthase
MIFGIGTDIVRIERMREALERHGDKFAERILSESELDAYHQADNGARYLAKRFAAKEATSKAMGTGFSDGLSLKHIVVSNDAKGKPVLSFFDQAESFIQENRIVESHLSLADEKEYAVAFVTLVRE